MSSDWIKVDCDLFGKPEVYLIAEALEVSPAEVVGLLVGLWSYFDQHTEDGILKGISEASLAGILERKTGPLSPPKTVEAVTRYVTLRNADERYVRFLEVLKSVNWIVTRNADDLEIEISRFDRHHSKSAKARALAAERQRRFREKKKSVTRNGSNALRALPEKRREEIEELPPKPPNGGASKRIGFDADRRKFLNVSAADLEAWSKAYPACRVDTELRAAVEWLLSNPAKAPKSSYRRFITNWLKRQQDRGGSKSNSTRQFNSKVNSMRLDSSADNSDGGAP